MTRSRKYAILAAGALLALLGLAVALSAGGDDSTLARPTTEGARTIEATATMPADETLATTEAQGATGPVTETTTAAVPERPYALAPTRSCLLAAGAAVSPVRATDPRLRALGDLAQRTSLEVRLDGRTLGVAFGDAVLLESLLRVPDDPYTLEVRRNALLMYRRDAREAAGILRGCLRS